MFPQWAGEAAVQQHVWGGASSMAVMPWGWQRRQMRSGRGIRVKQPASPPECAGPYLCQRRPLAPLTHWSRYGWCWPSWVVVRAPPQTTPSYCWYLMAPALA